MKKKPDIILMHMLENRVIKGERYIEAETLEYPLFNDENFDSISFDDYQWETRVFSSPFLSGKKKGEVVLVQAETTKIKTYLQIVEDEVVTNKAKSLFFKYNKYANKKFKAACKRFTKDVLLRPKKITLDI